jgi:hypothetical protein
MKAAGQLEFPEQVPQQQSQKLAWHHLMRKF